MRAKETWTFPLGTRRDDNTAGWLGWNYEWRIAAASFKRLRRLCNGRPQSRLSTERLESSLPGHCHTFSIKQADRPESACSRSSADARFLAESSSSSHRSITVG